MSRAGGFLVRMFLFVLVVGALAGLMAENLIAIVTFNPWLNGLILAVLVIGILNSFRQVLVLGPSARWINDYRDVDGTFIDQDETSAPALVSPMASMLSDSMGHKKSISALSMRSLLDSIASRLDESRETARYVTGLLVFLGLLGTFWGLVQTIQSVGATINGLNLAGDDILLMFDQLKSGIQEPLSGMGVAFSSSLIGLAGSLVVGFLDLQAGQAQNRFYNELEEWLSGFTKLSSGGVAIGDGDQSVPVYVQALLEQTAESMQELQQTVARANSGDSGLHNALLALSEQMAALSDATRQQQDSLDRIAAAQAEIAPALRSLQQGSGGGDRQSADHLRNIDVRMGQLLEDSMRGREEVSGVIRSEIKLLARTIAGLAGGAR